MSYMQAIDQRLRELFAEVADNKTSVDEAVNFIKDELLVSYRNGQHAGPGPRKSNDTQSRRPYVRR